MMSSGFQTTPEGWFEPTIGHVKPHDNWPWALPAYYCINFAPDPGEQVVGYSSKINGSSKSVSRFKDERCRVETVGFWRDNYRITELLRFKNRGRARQYAMDQFEALPAHYLMDSGVVVLEKSAIDLSGDWPSDWQFTTIRDLGVFCAYIYEKAVLRNANDFARQFRGSIGAAWPLMELIGNYKGSLLFAKRHASLWADGRDHSSLNNAIHTSEALLSQIAGGRAR